MLQFIEPWEEVIAVKQRMDFEEELQREVAEHSATLFAQAQILARRIDRDDFLFEIKNAQWRYAIVHLTFSSQPENASWPLTKLYLTENEVAARLERDAAEFN